MYPYLKELTLDEALQLKDLHPEVLVFAENVEPIKILYKFIQPIYEQGGKVFITALDYATHILKQDAPPEGYGYAAYELGSGSYDKLPYYRLNDEGEWKAGMLDCYDYTMAKVKGIWHRWAFRLTDLARVEGISEMETTETDWEAKYKQALSIAEECRDIIKGQAERLEQLETENNEKDLLERIAELEDRLQDAQNCIAEQEAQIAKNKKMVSKLVDDINCYTNAKQVAVNYEINLLKTFTALGAPYLPHFTK
jgi:hypothetical protein